MAGLIINLRDLDGNCDFQIVLGCFCRVNSRHLSSISTIHVDDVKYNFRRKR